MTSILGISHICVNSNNLEATLQDLKILNYNLLFKENHLPVSNEKMPFLRTKVDYHDSMFFKSTNNIGLEVINHGTRTNNVGSYNILFYVDKNYQYLLDGNHDSEIKSIIKNVFGAKIHRVQLSSLDTPFYYSYDERFDDTSTIVLECINLSTSSKFWQDNLGFKLIKSNEHNPKLHLLEFSSPIKNWCARLLLIETRLEPNEPFLDDVGLTCVSFITTNIELCLSQMKKSSARHIGDVFDMSIGGKNLKLVFIRGPNSEIIELMEFRNIE